MSKIPVIFAPGMLCDDRLFGAQARHLSKERPIQHADLSVDESIEGMASRLLSVAPDRFCLVGLSMGGILGFEAWRQAPERIAGLALLNTTPFADSAARQNVRLSQIERARRGQLKRVVIEELKPNYLGASSKQDDTLLAEIYAMASTLGVDVFVRQTHALMARKDSLDTLPTISCPTIIIAGQEDEICPPEFHEIIHRAVDASQMVIIPGCGHLSSLESPLAVTQALSTFLQQLDNRS